MMGWYHDGAGWGGWLLMSLLMVIFWGLVIFGGIAVWRAANRTDGTRGRPSRPSPEQLLEERFARGEIDVDEFNRRRDLLRSGR